MGPVGAARSFPSFRAKVIVSAYVGFFRAGVEVREVRPGLPVFDRCGQPRVSPGAYVRSGGT
ncbi:hypothetical protein MPNT_10208 [Candidatus Methylacidithermus pantelleriae]|uniref:Uncharacterized protein n=1 Tax=Candidatus Methylacidithermus pantelleriae TaxID=2744239 RepID=A0A8J2FN32_9BACT|nr:hypothetical protein MPNT_10208 [Candidatus Methylacidithermus pantelleriae]